jgi:hypothetical protein
VHATYLLPIRSLRPYDPELTTYLRDVSTWCQVVVVDGSPAAVFDAVHPAWSTFATHVRPDPPRPCRNGKVAGVLTGLAHATTPVVVIADDDVRYDRAVAEACVAALDGADVVRPQNVFTSWPWHARWDAARTLLNRATTGDFPGTLVVRREALSATGGYDGDVLFENLELIRTVEAAGGRVVRRDDLYVGREPPTARHFAGQRVRQAYDELARPWRLVTWCLVPPAIVAAWACGRRSVVAAAAIASMAAAEVGRRRRGGAAHFPVSASLLAPLWIAERGVCSWLGVASAARGGVRYAGGRIRRAATPSRVLRRRHGEVLRRG